MSSYLSQNREFQKNGKKIQKIEKKPLWLLFEPKYVGKGRESVKKKNHSNEFLPNPGDRIPKKQQKKLKN